MGEKTMRYARWAVIALLVVNGLQFSFGVCPNPAHAQKRVKAVAKDQPQLLLKGSVVELINAWARKWRLAPEVAAAKLVGIGSLAATEREQREPGRLECACAFSSVEAGRE